MTKHRKTINAIKKTLEKTVENLMFSSLTDGQVRFRLRKELKKFITSGDVKNLKVGVKRNGDKMCGFVWIKMVDSAEFTMLDFTVTPQ